ncbi:MAG: hypothetical protein WC769_05365 [Thermodesulfovibrionales bacterium]|jgi:hypothetical protein
MAGIKEKIMKEVEKIPKNKIAQLYDVVHLFRVEVESPKKAPKDMCIEAAKFFGIWNDISTEENAVLEEIQTRRKRTYRTRIL